MIFDRISETEKILNDIYSSKCSKLLFICSETGIGKSSLTKKIINSINNDILSLRIITTPENNIDIQSSGQFVFDVFTQCDEKIRELINDTKNKKEKHNYQKLKFDYYIKKQKNSSVRKIILKSSLNELFQNTKDSNIKIGLPLAFLLLLIQRITGLNTYSYIGMITSNNFSKDKIIIASEYIKYLLNSKKTLLNIDNIQNIDSISLKCLQQWLSCCNKTYFLLEYTLSDAITNEILHDILAFCRDIDIATDILHLKQLDSINAINIVKQMQLNNRTDLFFTNASNYYLDKSSGNVRKLIDYAITYGLTIEPKASSDPTVKSLLSINSTEMFILTLIIYHKSNLKKNLLYQLCDFAPRDIYINFESAFASLDSIYNLIEIKHDSVKIMHASIVDSFYKYIHGRNAAQLIAYRTCEQYYLNNINECGVEGLSYKDDVLTLLKIYSLNEPDKILKIYSHFENIIYCSVTPNQSWKYLKQIVDDIDVHNISSRDIVYRILIICSNLDMHQNAWYCLEKLKQVPHENEKNIFKIYKSYLLNALEEYENAIEYLLLIISNETDIYLRYLAYLQLLICYRSINNSNMLKRTLRDIEKEFPHYKPDEFGFFLRFAEFYKPRNESISIVSDSVDYFLSKGNKIEAAKSKVSLSYLLAITGNIDQAYENNKKAKKVLQKDMLYKYIFNVNSAAIMLLKGYYTSEVLELLLEAELSASGTFNILIILNNQIIWYYQNNELNKAIIIIKRCITLLKYETDKHLHAILNYNFYVVYKKKDMSNLADKHYNIAYEYKDYCHTLKCRLTNQNVTKDTTTFLLSKPWHVGFLSYWNISLENVYNTLMRNSI